MSTFTALVWRGGEHGHFAEYDVPLNDNQTVLDTVTHIQRHLDPTLAYRFACRVGMCGSCAMTVNDTPRWTCRTHVQKVIVNGVVRIAPLKNLPIIKDLAVDMNVFFEKMARAGGRFETAGDSPRPDGPPMDNGFARVEPGSQARRSVDVGIECIGCAVCYSACDVVAANPNYLGPAALNRAWTLVNDERDDAGTERLRAVSGDDGCLGCHTQQSCAEWCPKQLNPTAGIAGLKRKLALASLRNEL